MFKALAKELRTTRAITTRRQALNRRFIGRWLHRFMYLLWFVVTVLALYSVGWLWSSWKAIHDWTLQHVAWWVGVPILMYLTIWLWWECIVRLHLSFGIVGNALRDTAMDYLSPSKAKKEQTLVEEVLEELHIERNRPGSK